jgi:hypothetical protein
MSCVEQLPAVEREDLAELVRALEQPITDVSIAVAALRSAVEDSNGDVIYTLANALEGTHSQLDARWNALFRAVKREG